MDFQLSEAHTLIKHTAAQIAKDVIAPRAAEVDRTAEYPEDYFQAFRDSCLLYTSDAADE